MDSRVARVGELFSPDRVAVVGATESEGVGRAIVENLQSFPGEVIPVNPNYDAVFGATAYPDLSSIPGTIDLVIVVVPPAVAIDVVREAGELGVRNVVVITAGFGEAGSEGAGRERQLRQLAAEYDLALVGPNCLGIMNTTADLNATFGPIDALDGSISFMSQSGAFITAALDWATDHGTGFKDVVSLGNKAVLDETDFVAAWGDDPETEVILGYLESVEDGEAFVDTAREVTQETPVVVVKSGRTDAGAQAASSHTGAIAGSERAYEAALEQAGVIRAENVQELFDFGSVLEGQPLPDGDAVGIVTNAGGPGVMATDAVGDASLDLASFDADTVSALRESLPGAANFYNPVDVLGDADAERFGAALDAALADDQVAAAVVIAAPTAVLDYETLAERITTCQRAYGKPIVAALMGGKRTSGATAILRDAGVPNYFDPARAVGSLDALARYRSITERTYQSATSFDVDRERAREILESAAARDETRIGVEAMDLLDAYGIETAPGEIVEDPATAREVAEDLDGDVVMKIVSPDILHKSDIGGVAVGVSPEDAAETYEDLVSRARNYQPDATVLGVLVQQMVDLDSATETILGVNRDPQFGPLLAFGLGGIFVEILEDAAFRVAPVSEREATEMLSDIKSAPLLRGARGREPADRAALVESIQRLSQLVTDFPAILELDVNPLLATPDGALAVDVRLTIDPEEL